MPSAKPRDDDRLSRAISGVSGGFCDTRHRRRETGGALPPRLSRGVKIIITVVVFEPLYFHLFQFFFYFVAVYIFFILLLQTVFANICEHF